MFEFKQCKYYDKSIKQEHCPFKPVCENDCYFTLQRTNEYNEELQEQIDDLECELNSREDYEEELEECEKHNEALEDVIKEYRNLLILLGKNNEQTKQMIEETIFNYDIPDYNYILQKIREQDNESSK